MVGKDGHRFMQGRNSFKKTPLNLIVTDMSVIHREEHIAHFPWDV